MENQKPRYGNWISRKVILRQTIGTLLAVAAANIVRPCSRPWGSVLMLAAAVLCALTTYMLYARVALSYEGGGVQGKILDDVLARLDETGWNGRGKLLDIGCGSGALSVKAAKKYPRALISGVDTWGAAWEYSQRLCEENARLEGVSSRITFRKDSAADMDFLDDMFDAAVSNFVFHEVRSQPDKRALVQEALRVVRPGGYFVFQDVFFSKSCYGKIDDFVESLKPYVSEIHFVDTRRPKYAPRFLNTPLVLGQMGLIYGRK